MKNTTVQGYVPGAFFMEGKESAAGRLCLEDLAVLLPEQQDLIVAARFPGIHVGDRMQIPSEERKFMLRKLATHRRIALLCNRSAFIVCGEFAELTGLIPVLVPHGDAGNIAHMLPQMGRNDIAVSPALSGIAHQIGNPMDTYDMLTEQLALCDKVMRPEAEEDFRLFCAMTARLAGCRADVTALPVGTLPLHSADRLRFAAFLFCTLLAVRGESATGPVIRFGKITREEFRVRLEHTPERNIRSGLSDERFAFLRLPCFSDLCLTGVKKHWQLEFPLRRNTSGLSSIGDDGIMQYLEITLLQENT